MERLCRIRSDHKSRDRRTLHSNEGWADAQYTTQREKWYAAERISFFPSFYEGGRIADVRPECGEPSLRASLECAPADQQRRARERRARTAFERLSGKNCEAGENDPETLTVGGLTYLKRLDGTKRYLFR